MVRPKLLFATVICVWQLFAKYTAEGMPANQAAVVAMKAAKEELGI